MIGWRVSDLPKFVNEDGAAPPVGGACNGKPTEWWFPEFSRSMTLMEKHAVLVLAARAQRVCAGCEVSKKCLEYSLVHEPFGIWGGLDEQERLKIRTDRRIEPSYRTHAGLRPTRSKQIPYRRWLGSGGVPAHG